MCLSAASGMIRDLTFERDRLLHAASEGYTCATDFADWLVREGGVAFREAHQITSEAVKMAIEQECSLEALSLDDLQDIDNRITEGVYEVLGMENSVNSRISYGGTSPKNVREQITSAKNRFGL